MNSIETGRKEGMKKKQNEKRERERGGKEREKDTNRIILC